MLAARELSFTRAHAPLGLPLLSSLQTLPPTGSALRLITAASFVLQAHFLRSPMPGGRPPGSKKPSKTAAASAARWKNKTPDQTSDDLPFTMQPMLLNTPGNGCA